MTKQLTIDDRLAEPVCTAHGFNWYSVANGGKYGPYILTSDPQGSLEVEYWKCVHCDHRYKAFSKISNVKPHLKSNHKAVWQARSVGTFAE